jgi:carbohydrate-selective porin OprB
MCVLLVLLALEDRGITPTLTFVTDALGNPTGGIRQGFRAANNLGLDLRSDLEKLLGVHGGSFELSLSPRLGSSLSSGSSASASSFTMVRCYGRQPGRRSSGPCGSTC